MNPRNVLFFAATFILAVTMIAASIDHRGYLDLCVCVVNALARALTASGLSLAFGSIALGFELFGSTAKAIRIMTLVQLLAFVASIFFLIQYVFFLLEIVV